MISSQSQIITAKGNLLCPIINHPLSLVIELVVQWQLLITGQTEKTYTLLKIIILIDQYTMYWSIVCSSYSIAILTGVFRWPGFNPMILLIWSVVAIG